MSYRSTLLAAACALALAACGNDATPPPATDASATPPADVTAPVDATTPAAATDTAAPADAATTAAAAAPAADGAAVVSDCSTTIGSNDAMQFDASSIAIPASCTDFTIRLHHNGQMPVAAMGHNIVVAAQADMAGVLADGMAAGAANDYVKAGDTRVIAHTKLIGGGETTEVTFPVSKLQSGGPFEFFCSFPGHSALMKGTISVQ